MIEEHHASDDLLLEELPLNDPKWWCMVENGFIVNLLGEHKKTKLLTITIVNILKKATY